MLSYLKTASGRMVCIGISIYISISAPALAPADSFSVVQQQEMQLSSEALDLAVSSDGQWTFVLTGSGTVSVYSASGDLIQSIQVGKEFDSLEYSAAGNRLLLSSSGKKTVKVLSLAMIHELDYKGSPFKGAGSASVSIAVFDDFQ
jgi:DNA-binding beta-propeller fold protein YncE